jgi:hypothetical protein
LTRTSVVLMALAMAGCADTGPNTSLNGLWRGQHSSGVVLDLSLKDFNPGITGIGSLIRDSTISVDVSGTYYRPAVTLRLSSRGIAVAAFEGVLADDGSKITGTLYGDGFDRLVLPLFRQ